MSEQGAGVGRVRREALPARSSMSGTYQVQTANGAAGGPGSAAKA
jgi:hypothetical protein